MYRHRTYGRGSWYQAFFWVLVGILIGQFLDFDLSLQPRREQSQTQMEVVEYGV